MDLEDQLDAAVELGDAEDEIARLSKQNDRYERALREIAESPFCDYYYRLSEIEADVDRQYRTGVTDGHRAAASVARQALGLVTPRVPPK